MAKVRPLITSGSAMLMSAMKMAATIPLSKIARTMKNPAVTNTAEKKTDTDHFINLSRDMQREERRTLRNTDGDIAMILSKAMTAQFHEGFTRFFVWEQIFDRCVIRGVNGCSLCIGKQI